MTRQEIVEKLTAICKDLFENEELVLTDEMTVGDVDGWTSLTNMMLIADIEQAFGFKFKLKQLATLDNIGNIVNTIEANIQE